jgi:hypothetical protein
MSPSQWLRANRLPSVRGYCVRAQSYPPEPINQCLRPTCVHLQSRTREESTPDPTSLRPTRVRPHLWTLKESALGPTRPHMESAPVPTSPRPLARVRVQRGRAFTSGRTRPTARAINARLQSFPAGAPCSRVRPQQYINPFAPPHKSLYS